jgi:hypothetical protein
MADGYQQLLNAYGKRRCKRYYVLMLLCVGFEVLAAMDMKTSIFRNVSGEHVAFIFRVEE